MRPTTGVRYGQGPIGHGAFSGQAVDVGRLEFPLAVTTKITDAQIVSKNVDHIG